MSAKTIQTKSNAMYPTDCPSSSSYIYVNAGNKNIPIHGTRYGIDSSGLHGLNML